MQFDVLGELVRERPQDAADHDLFLDGEEAAVAVGDVLQPSGDCTEVSVVAGAGLEALEVFGDRARTELARRALTTRFDGEEAVSS